MPNSDFPGIPLFDAHREFIKLPTGPAMLEEYPDSKAFLEKLASTMPAALDDFLATQRFLKSYSRKVACLKSLYLRISELSDRPHWAPVWEHFWKDHDGNWWFKAFGKGRKIRDVSVSRSMWEYVVRYREYRGLPPSPAPGDKEPLLDKKGGGGLTSRQIARLVQDAIELAYARMKADGFEEDAKELRTATTHWLRHTGASQDIAHRPLKHMSDELGHASMGTTDRVYIQSDMKERAATGKSRKV